MLSLTKILTKQAKNNTKNFAKSKVECYVDINFATPVKVNITKKKYSKKCRNKKMLLYIRVNDLKIF